MSLMITVTIPIKPYLKKYLLSKSSNFLEPVRFPNRHPYNQLLINLVVNFKKARCISEAEKRNAAEYLRPSLQDDPNSIVIQIPYSDRKDIRVHNYLSEASKTIFRNEVKSDFHLEFFRFQKEQLLRGKMRKDIIEDFKQIYGMTEDDMKSESFYRMSSRMIENFNKNLLSINKKLSYA